MKLEVVQDLEHQQQIYTLYIPYSLWREIKFNRIDRRLFEECDKSEKISEKLLGMALLVRRIEEAEDESRTKQH